MTKGQRQRQSGSLQHVCALKDQQLASLSYRLHREASCWLTTLGHVTIPQVLGASSSVPSLSTDIQCNLFSPTNQKKESSKVLLAEKRGMKAGRQQVPGWWHGRKSDSEVQRKTPCLEGLPSWKSISPSCSPGATLSYRRAFQCH